MLGTGAGIGLLKHIQPPRPALQARDNQHTLLDQYRALSRQPQWRPSSHVPRMVDAVRHRDGHDSHDGHDGHDGRNDPKGLGIL